jgi:predicted ester cyclase
MTPQANKSLIREYLEALRKDKSRDTLDRFIAEEDLKQHIAMYEASLPGYWIEVEDIVAEDDKVVVRGTGHGVHTGQLMDIAPTGREVAFTLFITYRIADGKIVEHWMLADMLTLLQQVGALPAPAKS